MSAAAPRPATPKNPSPNPDPKPKSYASVYEKDVDSSDEERTHMSVLSRRLRKRRKTNSSLVSNPFGTPSHSTSDHAFAGFDELDDLDDEQNDIRRRKPAGVPESDVIARQRCFEYVHTAIDALWAEYCDSTSYAESIKYMPHSPVSEHEDPVFLSSGDERSVVAKFAENVEASPSVSASPKRSDSSNGHERSGSISMQPESQSLMRQKKRLVDAKYYLTHFVNAHDVHSSSVFWRVWDQLKYSAVDLVEGDDDEADEVIDDLEAGRTYYQ